MSRGNGHYDLRFKRVRNLSFRLGEAEGGGSCSCWGMKCLLLLLLLFLDQNLGKIQSTVLFCYPDAESRTVGDNGGCDRFPPAGVKNLGAVIADLSSLVLDPSLSPPVFRFVADYDIMTLSDSMIVTPYPSSAGTVADSLIHLIAAAQPALDKRSVEGDYIEGE